MNRERWQTIQRLLHEALGLDHAERAAFLTQSCGEDHDLMTEVESLVRAHLDDPAFLEVPVVDFSSVETPLQTAADQPSTIGPFAVVRPIGRGGMGEVFLGRQETDAFSRPVAIKVVKRGMDSDEVLRRFALERRILATLIHPNIAQLYDAGATADGRPYFVMEFVDGERIDAYCARLGLSADERLHLFRRVCGAVQHAHQNLIVHRDIKPGNVLVTSDGVPKLVDFGIGKILSDSEEAGDSLTRTRTRAMTPEYAAPEQARGEAVTTRTDVFGLGRLLRAMLGDSSRPSEVPGGAGRRGGLARDLEIIIGKATHDDPERRYRSAAGLSDDVERFLQRRPVRARPDSVAYRAQRFVTRNPWLVTTAATVVIALGVVTTTSTLQSRRIARERDKAREVQSFLLETFGAATSDGTAGDSVTVRQLLDGQVDVVETAYGADLELQAEMLAVLGDAYERLGLFDDAEALARRALDQRRSLYGDDHADVASALNLLGWTRHQQGASDEAVGLLEESAAMWRRLGPSERDGLARALNDLGSVHDQQGRPDDAEPLLREALALRRDVSGPLDRGVAVTSSNLAVLMYRRGDYQAADSLGQVALDALRASVGPDHQRTFISQGNLATFRWVAGDLEGAAELYEDLLERETRIGGGRNPRTASSMVTYASLLRAQGRPAEAEQLLREALAIQDEVLDPGHRDIANTLRVLGVVVQQAGRAEESLPLLERAVQVSRRAYGSAHPQVGEALVALALSRERTSQVEAAVALYQDGCEILRESLGAAHPRSLDEHTRLGALLLRTGRTDEAFAVFTDVHELALATPSADSQVVNGSRVWLAETAVELGDLSRGDSIASVAERQPQGSLTGPMRSRLRALRSRIDGVGH